MESGDIIKINKQWLETDWMESDIDATTRKQEYHRALFLTHLLTSLKRQVQSQIKVLKKMGAVK